MRGRGAGVKTIVVVGVDMSIQLCTYYLNASMSVESRYISNIVNLSIF